jgi:hypothetical protein
MQAVLILCICIAIANAQNAVNDVNAGAKNHGIACEHFYLKLQCPPGQHLNIFEANYGRTDNTTCPHASISTTDCHSNKSLIENQTVTEYFQNLCNGQSSCSALAENANYGDPCVGTYKYLGEYYLLNFIGRSYYY